MLPAPMAGPSSPPQPTRRSDPHDALPRVDRFQPRCGPVGRSGKGRWRAAVLIAVHVVAALHIAHWLRTGQSVTPVEPSEAMETLETGAVNAGAILFALLILGTLVLGRWFCGWACHVVALQDLCAWLLGRLGLRPRPVRSRLLILVPFVAAGYMFVWPTVARWWQGGAAPELHLRLLTDDLWRTFPGPVMAVATLLVCGFLIVWWLGAKGFCTYGCPYGGVFALAERFAPARIRVTDACEHCGHCTAVCTSNVRVHEEVARHGMVVDPGCMKCLDCVTVCPKDALYFGVGRIAPLGVSQQRRAARADFTWPEELFLAAATLFAVQWVWRGVWLGEPVPFLMALGLGVITAVFLLLGWRLLRRRDLTFQHRVLKSGGRLTGAGRVVGGVVAALGLVVAWLAIGNHQNARAIDAAKGPLRQVLQERRTPPPEVLRQAEAAVARAIAWSPGRDPRLLEYRGLLLRELGRHDEAQTALAEAVARAPRFTEYGAVALAIYLRNAGRLGEALALARAVLERTERAGHPNVSARLLVEQLGGR